MSIVIPDTLDALLVPIDAVRPDPSNYNQHSAPGSNRETEG